MLATRLVFRTHARLGWAALLLSVLVAVGVTSTVSLAQSECTAEVEPNQPELDAPHVGPSFCQTGDLPDDDQDFVLWDLTGTAPTETWILRLTGAPGILTRLEAYGVESAPGDPIRTGRRLLELRHEPDAAGPAEAPDLLLPDRLLIGIGRSDFPDGAEPIVTAYTLEAVNDVPIPGAGDIEPNDDAETATSVAGAFALSGDLTGSDDIYSWTVPDEQPAEGWRIDARGIAGTAHRLTLRDQTGRTLAAAVADDRGLATLRDLRLPPGPVRLHVSGAPPEGPNPYALGATMEVGPGDAEPNDDPLTAPELTLGTPTPGRLTSQTDIDFFRLPPTGSGEGRLIEVRLIWRSDATRELCLRTPERRSLQCRRSDEGIVLKDLLLLDDPLLLSVSGPPDPDDPYIVRIDTTSPPAPGWETEPNDEPALANELASDPTVQGSGAPDDADLYAFTATGEARLWRLDVVGSGIERVEWIRGDGATMGSAEVPPDGTYGRLLDMFFVPGQRQLFRVRSSAGEYRLTLEPLGPPDPNGEREPNDGQAFTDTLPVGHERTGRLATTADVDEYRFTTAATDHLVLRIRAPADGSVALRLTDDAAMSLVRVVEPGAALDLDVLLRTGDYRLILDSDQPGEDRYSVRIERADPFVLAQDQEPNDSPGWASSIVGDGRVVGTAPRQGDFDWYRLPTLEVAAPITLTAAEGVRMIDVMTDAHTALPLEADADGMTHRSPALAPGIDHFVRVQSIGDHAFSVAGLPGAASEPSIGRGTLTASVADRSVAAFWPAGQRLTGTLRLEGDDPGSLWRLRATTSDSRWTVNITEPALTLGPEGAAESPVQLLVPRDVPADVPVRVSFQAEAEDGTWTTAALELVPERDVVPADPVRSWSVPPALLGGLDVGSPSLGATLLTTIDPVGEAELHDGLAPADGGLGGPIPGLPLLLTVDLAGDEPVPIAGTILNALSSDPSFGDSPARFELELSLDGATWIPALSGSLARSIREQPFVLDPPTEARFARLRILSTHRGSTGRISLGEWKVVAVPGIPSPIEPIDLAEPERGGHVAWTVPQMGRIELAQAMLDEDPATLEPVPTMAGERFSWAVGFFEGRAARITSIEWSDPPASDPGVRFDRLEVSVSDDGPLGPWRELGTWQLDRAADGNVAPFTLEEATWARFVRFVSEPAGKEMRTIELPGAMRILEASTTDEYHSILGQWGLGERAGPFELGSAPAAGIADDPNDDSADRPRPLDLGQEASGRVHHGSDSDWYAISVPDGQRSLSAVVSGEPYVGVELELKAIDGTTVAMTFGTGERPGTVRYDASVEPGDYLLEVRQPTSSVVVTFDTSVSVGPYLDAILGSLRRLGADIIPGREAVRILPFNGEPILPGWNDQPFEIQAAAATWLLNVSSSGAEANLARAARDLAPRRGARAVLIITDAASSSYRSSQELWQELGSVRPLVFAVQTGGLHEAPSWQRHHLMTDWAASSGGVYRYAHSGTDIEDAFDHLATWLRRPAGYRLTVDTNPEELPPPEPGRLHVVAPDDGSGRPRVVLSDGVAVELILDTSGSMLGRIGHERRIDVAKRVLIDLVGNDLPPGIPVALRVFDDRARCETELAVPLSTLDSPSLIATIRDREVPRRAGTPLAAALEQVADDLAAATGPRVVVVLSDGRESCGGDPGAAVRSLLEAGVDVRLNVVGFGLKDRKDRRAMGELAELGRGSYFDARRSEDLEGAMAAAISAPYRVLDAAGTIVAEGTIGGAPVLLPSGTYAVEVAVEPLVRYDEVYVSPGGSIELELPVSEADSAATGS